MKKISLLAATMVMLSLVSVTAVGCGKKGTPNFVVPEEGFDFNTPVEITFYHTMSTSKEYYTVTFKNAIDAFEEKYPNITVTEKQVGGWDDVRDQIKTELSVGEAPDLAYCYGDHVALYNLTGKVVTLDPLMDSKLVLSNGETLGYSAEQKADFIEGFYDEGHMFGDGLQYMLPFSKSTEVLYYDKTFFTKNNLTVPTTWKEMEEVCKKIKEIAPNDTPLGYDSDANLFITMCEQYGCGYTSADGDLFRFNNKTTKEFTKMFREWYQKGYIETQTTYGAYTSGLFSSKTSPRCYMCIGSSAGATYQCGYEQEGGVADPTNSKTYSFETGIAPIPQVNPSKAKVISQGPNICMFNNGDDQKVLAAWLFLKYLTTDIAFQAEFGLNSGYVPVLKSVSKDKTYQEYMAKSNGFPSGIAQLAAKQCNAQVNNYYTSPCFVGSSEARDQVGKLLPAVMMQPVADFNDAWFEQQFTTAIEACEYSIL